MGSPVAGWRQRLAYRVVSGHGLAMYVLFTAPLLFFLVLLSKKHEGVAWLAGGVMASGFVGVLWLAPSLMTVSPHPARRGTAWQSFLRLFRVFVGNGEAIQGVARWIDPDWRNPFSGRTPQQTACWLASLERCPLLDPLSATMRRSRFRLDPIRHTLKAGSPNQVACCQVVILDDRFGSPEYAAWLEGTRQAFAVLGWTCRVAGANDVRDQHGRGRVGI